MGKGDNFEVEKSESSQRNDILLSVLAVIMTANMMIYNIPVFLPLHVNKRNEENKWTILKS
jgi:riboflavin transporter FmnP